MGGVKEGGELKEVTCDKVSLTKHEYVQSRASVHACFIAFDFLIHLWFLLNRKTQPGREQQAVSVWGPSAAWTSKFNKLNINVASSDLDRVNCRWKRTHYWLQNSICAVDKSRPEVCLSWRLLSSQWHDWQKLQGGGALFDLIICLMSPDAILVVPQSMRAFYRVTVMSALYQGMNISL